MENKILYYECKECSTRIPVVKKNISVRCSCRLISVTCSRNSTHVILTGTVYAKPIYKETIPKMTVYRIKHVSWDSYFAGKNTFNAIGRFYGRKPSMTWVKGYASDCVIEKLTVEKIVTIKNK